VGIQLFVIVLRAKRAGIPEMGLAAQVLDSMHGQSAAGVHARLERSSVSGWATVSEAETNSAGFIEGWDGGWQLERGLYRLAFDSDGYFAGLGLNTAYPEVVVIFRMSDESHTYQVQVALSPYSYSTFFGTLDS
jgi:5-hydroxyisourate hydrolase